MGKTIRLSAAESEAIRNKCIEFNKLLIKKGFPPLKDSELVHKILEISVSCAQVAEDGSISLAMC